LLLKPILEGHDDPCLLRSDPSVQSLAIEQLSPDVIGGEKFQLLDCQLSHRRTFFCSHYYPRFNEA
jgi:hypothetical protein